METNLFVPIWAHVELGKYREGQFQTEGNDSDFIKLHAPEPDHYNPKLEN